MTKENQVGIILGLGASIKKEPRDTGSEGKDYAAAGWRSPSKRKI